MEVEDWLQTDNQIQIDIFNNKYRHNNESFEEWVKRVSGNDPAVEKLIKERKFLFGGRVLANRGLKDIKITYSNCYCIPLRDSIRGIFAANGWLAETFSRGGGCGLTLSNLAPKGCVIHNAAKTTSGALSFAKLFNETTATIGQDGRRGALMLAFSSEHPDLEEFIDAKTDVTKLTHANLSVMASDAFMQAVINDEPYRLSFVRDTGASIEKTINAKKVFDKLIKNNYAGGEPGILFWDRIKQWSLVSTNPEFVLEGVNPCGELPLPAFGACCLGSFNLVEYLTDDKTFDFEEFEKDIFTVVKAMNDVLDEGLNLHPLQEQRDTVAKWRQIGIGVMSFADLLIKMGYKYGEQESLNLAEKIAFTLLNTSAKASALLAKDFGAYPGYNADSILENEFFNTNLSVETKELITKYGLRNATLISIAPTGTISLLLGHSNGIEPIFATKCKRKTESLCGTPKVYSVYSATVQELVNELNLKDCDPLPDYVITSMNINPIKRIRMQAVWQRYVDNSISSTVNLPNNATEEDVKTVYIEAWKHELKGITVYRDKSNREGVLSTDVTENVLPSNTLQRGDWKQLADDTVYYERRVYTGCASFALFIGWSNKEQKLQDVWVKQKGKGGCSRSIDAIVIELSAILRLGGSLNNIEKAFTGLETCNSFIRARIKGQKLTSGSSCADCILKTVKDFEKHMTSTRETKLIEAVEQIKKSCPECGEELAHEGGCISCKTCGYSKCS